MMFSPSTLPYDIGLAQLQEEMMETIMWKAHAPSKQIAPTSPMHEPIKNSLPPVNKIS